MGVQSVHSQVISGPLSVSQIPPRRRIRLVKAHAYGNDFLIAPDIPPDVRDLPDLAREVCQRHTGVGADGLMLVSRTAAGATMRLLNADGSHSEVSGNGVRCLGAWLAMTDNLSTGAAVTIETEAGEKPLTLISRDGAKATFRAGMGLPTEIREVSLDVAGQQVTAVVLRVGNPQCVVLGPVTEDRLRTIGSALAVHPFFRAGTNVELATVLSKDLVQILIWERGVGPTSSSGTGTCAAAVAAATFGGADRTVTVEAPGGRQLVEWTAEQLWLTGWAEVVADVEWWVRS